MTTTPDPAATLQADLDKATADAELLEATDARNQLAAVAAVQAKLDAETAKEVADQATIATLSAELAAATKPAPAAHKTLIGASYAQFGGDSKPLALTHLAAALPTQIIRQYDDGAGPAGLLADLNANGALKSGARVLASFKADAKSVTSGSLDAQIDPLLKALDGHELAFWHEPDQSGNKGGAYVARINPDDHKAANRHIKSRITALGVNVTLVLIVTGYDLADRLPLFADACYDKLGIDPYASSDTQTADQLIEPSLATASKVMPGKGVIIAEIGQPASATDAQQIAFIHSLAAVTPKLDAVCWFNWDTPTTKGRIDNKPSAAAALKALS